MYSSVFTESAPLGLFSHRVAMSVCGVVGMCSPSGAFFARPLIEKNVNDDNDALYDCFDCLS